MRQLNFPRLIELALVLCLIVGIIGYAASADVSLAFALPELPGQPGKAAPPNFQTGSNQLVVVAFSDTTGAGPFECPGCDKIFSSADQGANASIPLPPMEFVVHNARTGEELGRQWAQQQPQGRYQAIFQLLGDLQDDVVLSLASGPAGYQLCPNASPSRTISPLDFVLGAHEEVYPFWAGCLLQEPTASPLPPSPTPVPPTPTAVPPTATPVPTSTPLPERSIVVEAFLDVIGPGGLQCPGCDLIFSSSDQAANVVAPLPNMDFILRDADTGRLLARQTTTLDTVGRARARFRIPAGYDKTLRLELASVPNGYQLCPNVGPVRTIGPGDFILGTHLEQFPFWKGCLLPEPTIAPSPTATSTPRSSPTPTAAPLISPTPTATLARGTLTAVVLAGALNVRAGPGIEYLRLGAVIGGTKLILTGRNEAGTWVRGRTVEESLEGWLSATYLRIDGDVMTLRVLELRHPDERQATPTVVATDTLTAVVTARGLNVRAGPGVQYPRLGAVAGGTALILSGRNEAGAWVYGRAAEEELEGWLSAAYMRIDGDVMALSVTDITLASPTPTQPAATPTPTAMVIPKELPRTGEPDTPVWGLLAMASAILLALSHVWRWVREISAKS